MNENEQFKKNGNDRQRSIANNYGWNIVDRVDIISIVEEKILQIFYTIYNFRLEKLL